VKKLEIEIKLQYNDYNVADAIVKAVSPDNFNTSSNLSIKTTRQKNKVLTYINCCGKLSTFLATIDDLLFCISITERTLQITKKIM
jgi:hypothetical protein